MSYFVQDSHSTICTCRLNAIQQRTSTTEDEITNRLAVTQVVWMPLNLSSTYLFNMWVGFGSFAADISCEKICRLAVTYLNRTPRFEWWVVRCRIEIGAKRLDDVLKTCLQF